MVKEIKKIGNSKGIILDSAILEMAHLSEGDKVSITVSNGNTLVLTPVKQNKVDDDDIPSVVGEILGNNKELFNRLSK